MIGRFPRLYKRSGVRSSVAPQAEPGKAMSTWQFSIQTERWYITSTASRDLDPNQHNRAGTSPDALPDRKAWPSTPLGNCNDQYDAWHQPNGAEFVESGKRQSSGCLTWGKGKPAAPLPESGCLCSSSMIG